MSILTCAHVNLQLLFLYTFEFVGACRCGGDVVYYKPTDMQLLKSFEVCAETVFAESAFQSRIVLGSYENLWSFALEKGKSYLCSWLVLRYERMI